jgi:SAM-dependent methyltransferase
VRVERSGTRPVPGYDRLHLNGDKAISWGHPSYVWGFGQERRLELIRRFVALEGRVILDAGCGLGMYMHAFRRFSQDIHGVDIDCDKLLAARQELRNVCLASAENLPYPDGMFDVVLSHEVIEHVHDDRQAIAEAVRVLKAPDPGAGKPGGRLVVFAPNRLYPFETHGFYWRGRYRFGNIPLVNYLPDWWRVRFCPHVRAYRSCDLRRLLVGLPVRVVAHIQVFPAYDKIIRRYPLMAQAMRRTTYFLEGTPFRLLGLSHLLVVEKMGCR